MKQIVTLFALIGLFAVQANAQDCHSKKAENAAVSCTASAAKTAAAADETIMERVDPVTGSTYYVRKAATTTNGEATFTKVEYCNKAKAFVNVAPSKNASCCAAKATAPSCCASKAKTEDASSAQSEAAPKAQAVKN